MDVLSARWRHVLACALVAILTADLGAAGSARSRNFIVSAPTRALATEIAQEAERLRRELALSWLGQELPAWQDPCPVRADVNPRLGAGGATSFVFETEVRQFARPVGDGLFQAKPKGRPYGWDMSLQGSRERILDSVLPHEVTHTIFASYFGRPLPRWADEGACTTVEHRSEKAKQDRMLYEFLTTERGIAFNRMFSMTEYPEDILPLYSQGFSLARFLILQGGRQKFVRYVGDGLDTNNWTEATRQHYGFASISQLQVSWLSWVRAGSPAAPSRATAPTMIAANPSPLNRSAEPTRGGTQSDWQVVTEQGFHTPATPSTATSPTANLASSQSWYAQQKHRQQATGPGTRSQTPRPPARAARAPSRADSPQLATRPNHSELQREVVYEWGTPGNSLAPRLASPTSQVERR